jgi:hypothetical protein
MRGRYAPGPTKAPPRAPQGGLCGAPQRAALALDYIPIFKEDAERRKMLGQERGRAVQRGEVGLQSPDCKPVKREEKTAAHQAAKLLNVSGASVERMKAVQESKDEQLKADVMSGKVSLEKGAEITLLAVLVATAFVLGFPWEP